ncbi:MAG: phosphodiester glycosidase family protein [Anaerolineaceae bacterium]|nr:phosphodiester glycosidase family protein [Anaerolineaceae bacterium]
MHLTTKPFWLPVLLLVALIAFGKIRETFQRPPRQDVSEELFQGITYHRLARSAPRPLVIHILEIDLTMPGIDFLVTPGDDTIDMDLRARTTTEFADEFEVQIAVNGSFFEPFHAELPWDYYPKLGDPVNINGFAMSDQRIYSEDKLKWPILCLAAAHVEIRYALCDTKDTQGLAGNHMLLQDGEIVAPADDALHPRTAVATNSSGTRLWLIVIDGRQTRYSEGVTLWELAQIALEAGADIALNLDGGGSSTMVMRGDSGTNILNAPFHTNIPMRQRPVGNHLGIFALPLEQ